MSDPAPPRDPGQTIVMVSHEPWHREYFDRIVFIRDGLLDTERMEPESSR